MSQAEIWIYTTDYKDRRGPPIKVSTVECLVDDIPVDKHWILVYKSEEVIIYLDAYNKNGKLESRISYEEPQDVITKTRIGFVRATANDIHEMVYDCRVRGKTYGLNWSKGSCQSFVKEMLRKLRVNSNLEIINETFFGQFVEFTKDLIETYIRIIVDDFES
ncbi:UNVERIFIED_CONTAM: hypothetical protein RMT77_013043 [Armadillidium vulgare]